MTLKYCNTYPGLFKLGTLTAAMILFGLTLYNLHNLDTGWSGRAKPDEGHLPLIYRHMVYLCEFQEYFANSSTMQHHFWEKYHAKMCPSEMFEQWLFGLSIITMLVAGVSYISCCMTTDDTAILEIRELDSFLFVSVAEDTFIGSCLFLTSAIMLTTNCDNMHPDEDVNEANAIPRKAMLVRQCLTMFQIPQKYFIVLWGFFTVTCQILTSKIISSEKYGNFLPPDQQPAVDSSSKEDTGMGSPGDSMVMNSSEMLQASEMRME